jgi:hypothetical protein
MHARSSIFGLVAAVAISPISRHASPSFSLDASGAVNLTARGAEARYELTPEAVNNHVVLAINLGATTGAGALSLYTAGDQPIVPGRYPVYFEWSHDGDGKRWFHTCFIAGTPEHPVGMFHGQSGWVRITRAESGRLSGRFEFRASGILAADPENEDQWVTVRGTFDANGDGGIASVGPVAASGP